MEVTGRRNERSFKDIVGKSSAEADEVFCQPCSSEGDWVVAVGYCQNCNEYFCAACLKPHRKQSVTRHHIILKGDHMPKPHVSQIQLDPCSEPCVLHTNEIVKFYCTSHDAVGCSDCMVLNHKTCKVDRIQDLSGNYFSSQEHRELVGMVDTFINISDKLKHQVQKNKIHVNELCTKAVNDIKTFRKEVNDYLDKAEAEILTEVTKIKQRDEQMMSKLEADQQSLQNELTELEVKLNQQSNKANELFMAAKKMKTRMQSLDATLKQMFKNSQVKQYRFESSSEIRQIIAPQVFFGELTENPVQQQAQKKVVDMVPLFEGEVNVRAPGETEYCSIIASAIISPTSIVLLDYNNKSVKLVEIEQRKILARYVLKTNPFDVARVGEDAVAVTLPYQQKIQFLSITKDSQFSLERDMKVNCECGKLFFEQDKIIIACQGKIIIVNVNGNVVKAVSFPDLTAPTSIKPAHDNKSFFVSNTEWEGKPTAIYKLNLDDCLLATYKDKNLSGVEGLTVTRDGTVLVCKWSNPGRIHVVSPECRKIKNFLQHNEHVRGPYCVSYCEETNKLFVCNYLGPDSEDKINDTLKIFQMY